jgi:hypothetical protein
MAVDYSRLSGSLLSSLGSGLMAAGSQGGWNNFAPGFAQGQQQFQQNQLQQDERADTRAMRELQQQQLQMQIEAQRTANQDRVKQQQAMEKLLGGGMMSPNGMSQAQFGGAPQQPGLMSQNFDPQQIQFLQTLGADAAPIMAEQLFKTPTDKWQITDVQEGNEKVTYRINPQTGTREEIGRGPAFSPRQMTGDSGGGAEYGLMPFYTTDDKGVTHAYQLSKGGGFVEVPIPEGQKVAPNTQYLNTDTGYMPMDRRTGAPVGPEVARDVAGAKEQAVLGESTGQAAFALPDTLAKADNALGLIESVKTDPARQLGTGMSSFMGKVPGTAAYDFAQKVNQLKGQAFLDAFASLKGGGAISEIEGQKATQAIGRLDAAQTEEGFLQALSELETIIKNGKERSIKKAKQSAGPSSVDTLPPGFQ